MTLNNIETDKISKKSKLNLTHDMLHIDQSLNVNILLLTLSSSSAVNTEKPTQQFLAHLLIGTIRIFPAYSVTIPSGIMYTLYMVKSQIRVRMPYKQIGRNAFLT